ncbi:MAG TPA: 1-acyl-sn-glycerol-3-phosphate acyltransferase [Streptosporangiaceae bacterium]
MPGPIAGEPAGARPGPGLPARLLTPLRQRIVAGRADESAQRDPDYIRKRLPAIARYTSYFSPEVRGLGMLPADGPALVVGNHSCLFYMPEVWVTGQAILSRRGIAAPTHLLAYDLLFGVPGVASVLRRLGAVPASTGEAEAALARGSCVLVYPGGDLDACRPWADRNRIDFGGRKGFVRLALKCGVPVVPVVAHGAHHAVVVLTRGDRLARAAGLSHVRVNVFPLLAGIPFGVTSILTPPLPMPAQLTIEFLPSLDWTGYGPGAADDKDTVSACYEEVTGRMQAALDRLSADIPHPVLSGSSRLAARTSMALLRRAANLVGGTVGR